MKTLAEKSFAMRDQQQFALESGDYNPMHVDALAARRTPAGAPVVHGIHLLLWALNSYAAAGVTALPALRSLKAQFKRSVYLNEAVTLAAVAADGAHARLRLAVGDATRAEFFLEFGGPCEGAPVTTTPPLLEVFTTPVPLARLPDELVNHTGQVPVIMSADQAESSFPAVSGWLGSQWVRDLAASSYLVGMVSPGLHSIYSELSVHSRTPAAASPDLLGFRVTRMDRKFSLLIQEITGSEFVGTLRSFMRAPPVVQPALSSLQGRVRPDEFAGSSALVVGGSRGLGELTAKLIAAGGGKVYITYKSGEAEAARVAEEIRASGAVCEIFRYDATLSAPPQLPARLQPITHAYYFATPVISRPRSTLFNPERLQEFLAIYVNGFWELTQALRSRHAAVSLLYPSTVFVDERPVGMTEYAMAKAAGECLCSDINAHLAPVHVIVQRLPRLLTDQSNSLTPVKLHDAVEVLLAAVRAVQHSDQRQRSEMPAGADRN